MRGIPPAEVQPPALEKAGGLPHFDFRNVLELPARAPLEAEGGRSYAGDTGPDRLRHAAASGLGLLHKPVSEAALRLAIGRALAARAPGD